MFERNKCRETTGICTSDLKVREEETKAHDCRVDRAFSGPRLLLQTEVRGDPDAARVNVLRGESRGNMFTNSPTKPGDISANAAGPGTSPLTVSLGVRVPGPLPEGCFPLCFPDDFSPPPSGCLVAGLS